MTDSKGKADFDAAFARKAAERYEREFVPAIGRPVAQRLVGISELQPGDRVLDVACGTGVVARLAAERVGPEGSVTGLDPNPAMIDVARQVAPSESSIDWQRAPAEGMPFDADSFDVALCGMGLQFFEDRAGGLREIRRVLVPGGRLVANVPGPTPPPLGVMADGLARHVGPRASGFVEAVFSLHGADELRKLVSEAGFTDVRVHRDEVPVELGPPGAFLWSYIGSTPLAAVVAKLDEEGRSALEREYAEACEPFLVDGVMRGAVRMTTVVAAA